MATLLRAAYRRGSHDLPYVGLELVGACRWRNKACYGGNQQSAQQTSRSLRQRTHISVGWVTADPRDGSIGRCQWSPEGQSRSGVRLGLYEAPESSEQFPFV